MLAIVTGTFRLYASRWPALIAIYLAGWIARFLLIRFAGYVANIDPLFGLLVLPLAVLARLVSYVAMFLVLRGNMPGFSAFDVGQRAAAPGTPRPRFADVIGSSILPFFVVFATWGLLRDDFVDFSLAQLQQRDFGSEDLPPLDVTVTPVTIGVVVGAFLLRLVIKRLGDRIPLWTSYIATYLEAVWILIAVVVIQEFFAGLPVWLQARRLVAFLIDSVNAVKETFAPFAFVWDAAAWLIDQAGTVLVLPLAWLTLAGIVYGRALVGGIIEHPAPGIPIARVRDRWQRVPGFARRFVTQLGGDFGDRWRPISDSTRLIWGAGAIAVGIFALSYAVLDTSAVWVHFGVDRLLIGPQELQWWFASDKPLSMLVELVVEPLRICLIAAAYDVCLRLLVARQESLATGSPVTLEPVETSEGEANVVRE